MSFTSPSGPLSMAPSPRQAIAFAIGGPIGRVHLSVLCERVCALLEHGEADIAVCDVRDLDADAVTVDALARLQIAARRHGCQVRLCHASSELRELLDFIGLGDVLPD